MTEITHQQIELSTGINMHIAETGDGPAVVFCHGFPELWYSWRHQLPVVAEAGFRAIAPDMRGYGETDAPPNAEDYTQELICADMVALLDALEIDSAVFVGQRLGRRGRLEHGPAPSHALPRRRRDQHARWTPTTD